MSLLNAGRLASLLREAAELHHISERVLPAHDWQDWYAVYIWSRLGDDTKLEASRKADRAITG